MRAHPVLRIHVGSGPRAPEQACAHPLVHFCATGHVLQRIRPSARSLAALQAAPRVECVASCSDQRRCRHLRRVLRTKCCESRCCEHVARHASSRGASSPRLGRCRSRGGDTRRRAAPLSNPRPAQPAPPAIRPFARRNELEPQPPAGGRRALARANPLLAVALRACGARRATRLQARRNRRVLQRSCWRRATGGARRKHGAQRWPPAQRAARAAGRAAARCAEQCCRRRRGQRGVTRRLQPHADGRRARLSPMGCRSGGRGSSAGARRCAGCRLSAAALLRWRVMRRDERRASPRQ